MPADDPQRVWYPKLIDRLRATWQPGMPFDGIVGLRDNLETLLQEIRTRDQVQSPTFRCRYCGIDAPGPEPHVSVRAMIVSLVRFEIATAEETYATEKAWAAHRKQHSLDIYGAAIPENPMQPIVCEHSPALPQQRPFRHRRRMQ
jgi:hypothetical protein